MRHAPCLLTEVLQEAGQLDFEHARIDAFEDGDHAFEHHLAALVVFVHADAHLAGKGQEEEIGGADAIDGGDKGDGDAAADLLNVVQVLHDLNQSQNGAEDADGGRKAASRLEDRGQALVAFQVESRLTCMILRSSLGSVPSTASISACLRKGSWMVCRSLSSETTPLRRALLAKVTSRRSS